MLRELSSLVCGSGDTHGSVLRKSCLGECGALTRNGPYKLRALSAGSSGSGTTLEGLGL